MASRSSRENAPESFGAAPTVSRDGDDAAAALSAIESAFVEDAQKSMEDLVVDARWLDHPEPMEKILAALETLQSGQRVLFKIHREPYPLYRILEQNNYCWKLTKQDDGTFDILIWEE